MLRDSTHPEMQESQMGTRSFQELLSLALP